MKTPSFYQSIVSTLLAVMAVAAIALIASCELIPAIAPDDWAWNPPAQDSIDIDTTQIDTIGTDTIVAPPPDTCTELIEITDPPFVYAYMEITDDVQTERTLIIGNYSYVIPEDDTTPLSVVIDSLWELYRPEYSYQTIVDQNDSRKIMTFIKGTNNRQQFYLKAQIRFNGYKQYFGFSTQEIIFATPLTADQYAQKIDEYPSVARFGFYGTNYDSLEYIKLSLLVLGHCKHGRELADFRFNPYPMTDSIINAFEQAGWEQVLH